jgi:hypothetical protein
VALFVRDDNTQSGAVIHDVTVVPLVVSAVKRASLTHKRFRVGSRSTAVTAKAPRGTSFRFTLRAPARMTITISRAGKKVGRLTRRNLPNGRNTIPFSGRIGRALKPGAYVAKLGHAVAFLRRGFRHFTSMTGRTRPPKRWIEDKTPVAIRNYRVGRGWAGSRVRDPHGLRIDPPTKVGAVHCPASDAVRADRTPSIHSSPAANAVSAPWSRSAPTQPRHRWWLTRPCRQLSVAYRISVTKTALVYAAFRAVRETLTN